MMSFQSRLFLPLFCLPLAAFVLLMATPVMAQDEKVLIKADVMDMPVTTQAYAPIVSDGTTHPILNLTQDKSEMIKLNQKAASVIVGNPSHVSVLLDTPDTLIVVPRAPGASHFSVVGEDGAIIMQRHVIVGAAKENYVRIRRSCNANSRNCQETSTYFCPDTCHEIEENLNGPNTRRR